jgi:hypothetical protein
MIVMVVSPLRSGADLQSDRAAANRSAPERRAALPGRHRLLQFLRRSARVMRRPCSRSCFRRRQPTLAAAPSWSRSPRYCRAPWALTICSIALDMVRELSALTPQRFIFEQDDVAHLEQSANQATRIWFQFPGRILFDLELPARRPVKSAKRASMWRAPMDEPVLPRHVLERAERRWASILSHQAAHRRERKLPATQQSSPDSTSPPSQPRSDRTGTGPSDLRLQR